MHTKILITLTALLAVWMPARAADPVTTLDQQLAIWDAVFAQIEKDPSSLARSLPQIVPQYGYWCGLQSTDPTAAPIDCVDGACREHDLSPGYSLASPTLAQIGQADQQFIANLYFATPSTPYGALYQFEAIQIFEEKITYEQANKISLIAPCQDCLTSP
jgi:hypothetical protein